MDLAGEDAQDFGPLGTFRRQERQESRQEGRIWSLNEYLIEDRALKNSSRIERNEGVDVDKTRPDHVFRKCEDVRRRNENCVRGRDFAPSQYQARSFLARNLRPSYRSTAPFVIAPFVVRPYGPVPSECPVPRNWPASPDFLCLVP